MKPETLTEMERLQLMNQYAILEKLDHENAQHYAELQIILQQGYTFLYHKVFDPVWNDELSMQDCRFVLEVFDLHDALLHSYAKLEDKEGITEQDIAFWGFDGNNANEAHMSCFARYMQERPREFSRWRTLLDNRGDLNSHLPTKDRYRRMLAKWSEMDGGGGIHKYLLTKKEIKEIVDAPKLGRQQRAAGD